MRGVLFFAILFFLSCAANKNYISGEVGNPLRLNGGGSVFIMPPPISSEIIERTTGGRVSFIGFYPDGKVKGTLYIPAGFSEKDTLVEFGLIHPNLALFEVKPSGLKLLIPGRAEIELPHYLDVKPEDIILFYRDVDKKWRELNFDAESKGDTLVISFEVDYFTLFALVVR